MSTCRHAGRNQPRLVNGHHLAECHGDDATPCAGCLPCEHPHCRVCGREHAEQTCPSCLATAREHLTEIGRMVADLPAEVEVQGIDSEAMNLLGPAADAERRGHVTASIAAGRVDAQDYEQATHVDLLHPRHVIGCWDMLVRDALDHDEPEAWTIADGIAYLDMQLTYLAAYPHLAFEELATEVHDCRRHLERVLHDGEQVDTGAPCLDCRTDLRRVYAGDEFPWSSKKHPSRAEEDVWACPRCRTTRDNEQYRLNVAHAHRAHAEWLTGQEMEIRTGVRLGTVRVWAQRGEVAKRRDSGRTLYSVADVEKAGRRKGLIA